MIAGFNAERDEPVWGAIARYGASRLMRTRNDIMNCVVGMAHADVAPDLPGFLGDIAAHLQPGHSLDIDALLLKHTAYPYFAAFASPEKAEALRQSMVFGNGRGIHARAGLTASPIPRPQWLRYCPACAQEDRCERGYATWRVAHQVWPVQVCPIHKVWLENSNLSMRSRPFKEVLTTADAIIPVQKGRHLNINEMYDHLLYTLAQDVCWLLANHNEVKKVNLKAQYQTLLAEQGLATYRGNVRTTKLLEMFSRVYPTSILTPLGVKLNSDDTKSWLARLVGETSTSLHPTYHLLLIHFLGHDAKTFFQRTTQQPFFGDGPWPCLNPVCNDFLKTVIQSHVVEFRSDTNGKPVGIFACHCGFTYMRVGPDKEPEDRLRKNRIEAYGPVWEKALQDIWDNEEFSLRMIASRFGTDSATIKRNALRLRMPCRRRNKDLKPLPDPIPAGPTSGSRSDHELLEQYKEQWLAGVHAQPNAGMKALAQQMPSAYSMLYRRAPEWLTEHTPQRAMQRTAPQHMTPEANAVLRSIDRWLAKQVVRAAKAIRTQAGRPVRITACRIAQSLGSCRRFLRRLHVYPRTTCVLAKVTEDSEAFAFRRIRFVVMHWSSDQGTMTYSKLLDIANAWPYRNYTKIKSLLNSLGFRQELISRESDK
ncbi:MAG: hypothetical protein HGB35_02845 [Geobacteraceae bacterium]|nr:hypothetical protein [Geobacteraceae bacterium]